jgi:hypothetical protein
MVTAFVPGLYRSYKERDPYIALWQSLVADGGRRQTFVQMWHPLTYEMYVIRDELFTGRVVIPSGSRVQRFELECPLDELTPEGLEEMLKPLPRHLSAARDTRSAKFKAILLFRRAFEAT